VLLANWDAVKCVPRPTGRAAAGAASGSSTPKPTPASTTTSAPEACNSGVRLEPFNDRVELSTL
jgi:hypothetical protein